MIYYITDYTVPPEQYFETANTKKEAIAKAKERNRKRGFDCALIKKVWARPVRVGMHFETRSEFVEF